MVGKPPKSAYELAMERLRADDRKAGVEKTTLTAAQKKKIGEARQAATARLAERILFRDPMQRIADPAARETAEQEYQIDRRRITEDCEKGDRGHPPRLAASTRLCGLSQIRTMWAAASFPEAS